MISGLFIHDKYHSKWRGSQQTELLFIFKLIAAQNLIKSCSISGCFFFTQFYYSELYDCNSIGCALSTSLYHDYTGDVEIAIWFAECHSMHLVVGSAFVECCYRFQPLLNDCNCNCDSLVLMWLLLLNEKDSIFD